MNDKDYTLAIDAFKAGVAFYNGFKHALQSRPATDSCMKSRRSFAQDEDKWITLENGQHVLIDGDSGEVKGGMGGKFDGQNISDVGGKGASENSKSETAKTSGAKTESKSESKSEQAQKERQEGEAERFDHLSDEKIDAMYENCKDKDGFDEAAIKYTAAVGNTYQDLVDLRDYLNNTDLHGIIPNAGLQYSDIVGDLSNEYGTPDNPLARIGNNLAKADKYMKQMQKCSGMSEKDTKTLYHNLIRQGSYMPS